MQIIKLSPFFSERLWGGQQLQKYGFQLPADKLIGEAWVISALDNGLTYITNGENQGQSLKTFFEHNRSFFNNEIVFPLLTKIISANDYLSVQVHPDDEYGLKHNKMLGKPECWYVLDAPKNAQLIYGHNAINKVEFETMVNNKEWNNLFTYVDVKAGDFIYVPPGKVHAITPGITVYELQRSSDITYRFYDFDRVDKNGVARPLHIQECLDVTLVPDLKIPIIHLLEGKLIDNEYFTLYLIISNQELTLENTTWIQFTLLNGKAKIGDYELHAGESGIIYDLHNNLSIICEGKLLISFKRNKK